MKNQEVPLEIIQACSDMLESLYADSEYDLSRIKKHQIACQRTQFIGHLTEGLHYALFDFYEYKTSFYKLCKDNDDNVKSKYIIHTKQGIQISFELENVYELNIHRAAERAQDFGHEFIVSIDVNEINENIWNITINIDMASLSGFLYENYL